MHIVIAGGRGFIGTELIKNLLAKQHKLTLVSRTDNGNLDARVDVLTWDAPSLATIIANADVVINLVGENIANKRWSEKQKQRIIDSRVKATQTLVKYIEASEHKARLINASAIGIYGVPEGIREQNEQVFSEPTELPQTPHDFLQEVGFKWEHALKAAVANAISLCVLRFGVVISPKGGMLKQLLPVYKLGLGGRVGSGEQPLSWVALEDVVSFIIHLIDNPDIQGTFNVVAPDVVKQKDFARELAQTLRRPAIFPLPSVVVKLVFGEMGKLLLLNGQRVKSTRLSEAGFDIKFKTLKDCLRAQLTSQA